jgi:hypothetical protein
LRENGTVGFPAFAAAADMVMCGLSCDLHNRWRFCAMARKRAAGKVTGSQGDAAIDIWMDFNCQIFLRLPI